MWRFVLCRSALTFTSLPTEIARNMQQLSTSRDGMRAIGRYSITLYDVDPLTGASTPITLPGEPTMYPGQARLAASGTELFVRFLGNPTKLARYTWDGASWGAPLAIELTDLASDAVQDITAASDGGAGRRLLVLTATMTRELREYELEDVNASAMVWRPAAARAIYPEAELGVAVRGPDLSPEGLRAVYTAHPTNADRGGVYMMERPAIDVPFGPPSLLYSQAETTEEFPHLGADCQRLYFNSENRIYVVTP